MAYSYDVLPTILDLCKVQPAQWTKPLDGQSLVPLLRDPNTYAWPDDRLYCVHFVWESPDKIPGHMWENGCVRGERYKLVNGNELYDLKDDSSETRNLAQKMPEQVESMRKTYEQWFSSVYAERKLHASPRYIGSSEQPTTYLYPADKDETVSPAGWPVEVVSTGSYTIGLDHLRKDMFGDNVQCVLRCGDLTVRKPVEKRNADLVFEDVHLPVGTYTFQIDFEGDVNHTKVWRYGLKDLGHRLIWVRKEK
jgi:hypothetical protein